MTTPRPPAGDASALQRLGWALRIRRGERSRRQLHDQLGYSVSTIKQVEMGVYRSDLRPFVTKWAQVHGGLDDELQRLWAQVQDEHGPSHESNGPAATLPSAGVLALPAAPPGTAYVVIPVPIDTLPTALELPLGSRHDCRSDDGTAPPPSTNGSPSG